VIGPDVAAEIRRQFFAEHWKIGTIASQMHLSWDTVRLALETDRFNRTAELRACLTDPYIDFIKASLERYPELRATRIYEMLKARGFPGKERAVRRTVAGLRPTARRAFLRLSVLPGEQAQVDWAHFGTVRVGRAERRLSCFVMVLSHSRALYLEFTFDQSVSSFLSAHVRAFSNLGIARTLLYDNLRSAVLARRGEAVHLHPRLLELSAHYHFQPRFCAVGRGNEKGRVERVIGYVRHSFFAARPFTGLSDFNRKALVWRDEVAHQRPWPGGDHLTVGQAWEEERTRLLPLPEHAAATDQIVTVRSQKTPYVRFDLNDYSLPPQAVGRELTLVASGTTVRLVDGATEIARHERSWDRHAQVEDPEHIKALIQERKRAGGMTRLHSLLTSVPSAEAFLEAAVSRGESDRIQADKLVRLAADYGSDLLERAVAEALSHGTPNAASVTFLLQKLVRSLQRRPALPVTISSRPELINLAVSPRDARSYDALHSRRNRDDDPNAD
jgi:transposase